MSNPEVTPGSFALIYYKEINKIERQSFFETIGAHLVTHFNVGDDLKIDIIKVSPYHSSWIRYNFNVFTDADAIAEIINMMSGYQMDCIPNFMLGGAEFPFEPKIPNDSYFPKQWGLTNTKTDQVWGIALGQGVKVGIMDSGVDLKQPDLQGNLLPGYDCVAILDGERNNIQQLFTNEPNYESSYEPDNKVYDTAGHGTAVAGIIGATTNNDEGIAAVAPLVKLIPFKVCSSQIWGRLDLNSLAIITGFAIIIAKSRETGTNVVDILNYSIGRISESSDYKSYTGVKWKLIVTRLVDKMVNELGILFVAAAGNEGQIDEETGLENPIEFPAMLDTVISVGAINQDNKKADFSSYGANWVNIAAPGVEIYTTLNTSNPANRINMYGPMDGTSYATPIVSGIAALVLGHLRTRLNRQKRNLGNPQIAKLVTQALYESATQTLELEPYFQYGKVNALEAIKIVDDFENLFFN